MAVENIIDEIPGNANLLVNELKNNFDFIYEVVMNNGANLLLYLSVDLWNPVVFKLVLNNSK